MAQQTIDLPANRYRVEALRYLWEFRANRTEIDSALATEGTRYFYSLSIFNSGQITLSFVDNNTSTSDEGGQDLSDRFELHGSIVVTAAGMELTAFLDGSDTEDAYAWTPGNSAEVIAFANHLGTQTGNVAGTLLIRDTVFAGAWEGTKLIGGAWEGIKLTGGAWEGMKLS